MVLTVSFVIFPVIGLCCHRRQRETSRRLDASVEASEPHDFVVRFTRCSSAAHQRPLHPAPNVFDDRETPLLWERDGAHLLLICFGSKAEYFFRRDWTASIALIWFNIFADARGLPHERCRLHRALKYRECSARSRRPPDAPLAGDAGPRPSRWPRVRT